MTHKHTYAVDCYVHNCVERARELFEIAKELRAFATAGQIEHFPEDCNRFPERKKMVVSMDKNTAARIFDEAKRMELEARQIMIAFGR